MTRVRSAQRVPLHHKFDLFLVAPNRLDLTIVQTRPHIAPDGQRVTLVSVRALSRGRVRRQAANLGALWVSCGIYCSNAGAVTTRGQGVYG